MIPDEIKNSNNNLELEYLGLSEYEDVLWNLSPCELYEQAIQNKEAILTNKMAMRVLTGKFTGRSPMDRLL